MRISLRPLSYYLKLLLLVAVIGLFILILILVSRSRSFSATKRSLSENALRNASDYSGEQKKAIHCYLFLAILSSPIGAGRRKGIRNTWLQGSRNGGYKVVHKFVVGTKGAKDDVRLTLLSENRKENDLLLLEDLQDSYSSLTLKLLKTVQWVAREVNAKFFMKADDDSFARLDILTRDLAEKEYLGRLYWGFFRGNANVKRAGSWAERSWYLCDHYLPYALGGGYIISFDLVKYVSRIADMVQLYNSEDVSMGTWLAPVRLNRIHDIRFDTEYKSRGCSNKHIISHKQSVKDMFIKHNNLLKHGKLCVEERVIRHSFDYNWAVPPSKCCQRKKGSSKRQA